MDVQDAIHEATLVADGQSNAIKDITFGSIAGMASKLFEHPFDLVKVRLQSQPTDRPPTFAGPLDCFRQTWGKEGWKGLYRGVSAPLVGAACENACLFLTYNKFQDIILSVRPSAGEAAALDGTKIARRQLTLGELALAAGAAGATASFLLTPIELVKCRMQVQRLAQEGVFGTAPAQGTAAAVGTRAYSTAATASKAKLQGPFEIVRSTVAAHGIRGLWLGQTGTLFRETGGSAAWFGAYEAVSRAFISVKQKQANALGSDAKITKKDLSTLQLMAAGACAGMSYNVVLFPADCVKSAMQTQEELRPRQRGLDGKSIGEGPKFWGVAKRIYQSRGIRGLYAGCGVTVARAAPSSAMIFLIYETLESRFGDSFA